MTTLTNYIEVNKSSYDSPEEKHETAGSTLKEKIGSMMYPAIGLMGIYYQIYLLLFS